MACTKALEIKRGGLKTKSVLEVNSVGCADEFIALMLEEKKEE